MIIFIDDGGAADYEAEVLADSPVAFWRFSDAQGATAADSSGNGRDITTSDYALFGLTNLFAGSATTCAEFDGSCSRFTPADSAAFRIAGDVTITAIIALQRELIDGESFYIESCGANTEASADNFQHAFRLRRESGTTYIAWLHESGGGNNQAPEIAWTPSANTPYHIAGVRDATAKTVAFYVNGSIVGTAQSYTTNADGGASTVMYVGSGGGGNDGNNFLGFISDVAIFSSALSSTRIAAHYAALGAAQTPPTTYQSHILSETPAAYFRLNELVSTAAINIAATADYTLTHANTTNETTPIVVNGGPAKIYNGTSARTDTGTNSTVTALIGDASWECWIKFSGFPSSGATGIIWSQAASGETEATNYAFHIGVTNTAGTIGISSFHESGAGTNNSITPIAWAGVTTGVTYHLVVTRDTATKTIEAWANGSSIGSATYANNPTGATATHFGIGRENGSATGSYINARIDEVAVYSRKLTSTEIGNHYAAGT